MSMSHLCLAHLDPKNELVRVFNVMWDSFLWVLNAPLVVVEVWLQVVQVHAVYANWGNLAQHKLLFVQSVLLGAQR